MKVTARSWREVERVTGTPNPFTVGSSVVCMYPNSSIHVGMICEVVNVHDEYISVIVRPTDLAPARIIKGLYHGRFSKAKRYPQRK